MKEIKSELNKYRIVEYAGNYFIQYAYLGVETEWKTIFSSGVKEIDEVRKTLEHLIDMDNLEAEMMGNKESIKVVD